MLGCPFAAGGVLRAMVWSLSGEEAGGPVAAGLCQTCKTQKTLNTVSLLCLQKLAPEWAKAATAIKAHDPSIVIAKVQSDQELSSLSAAHSPTMCSTEQRPLGHTALCSHVVPFVHRVAAPELHA